MKKEYEDDGYVIADMSGIERRPLLLPRFDRMFSGKGREQVPDGPGETKSSPDVSPEVSEEERRALIGGSIAAGILIVGILAAVFAIAILLIGHIG